MNDAPHDPARPDITSMRATLATARAILTGVDPEAVHDYAGAGSCDACTVVAALQLGFTFAAALTTEGAFMTEPLRASSSSWSTPPRPSSTPRRT